MSEKTNKQYYAELAKLVTAAEFALTEAQNYADTHGLEFIFSPAYGMGGTYVGVNDLMRSEYDEEIFERDIRHENGWLPSSQSC